MISQSHKRMTGFTLIEMLLVMVIVSALIYMGITYMQQRTYQTSVDKASLQMQQILNAALSYYVNNNAWPKQTSTGNSDGLACLQATEASGCTVPYLTSTLVSPLNISYETWLNPPPNSNLFYAIATVTGANATSTAQVIAGTLPLAFTTNDKANTNSPCVIGDKVCYVYAAVNVPGQNLNNAGAVTFAGIYSNGGCVPEPKCPVDKNGYQMKPSIMVVPVAVNGINDAPTNCVNDGTTSGCDNINVYPISSFTAYATPSAAIPNNCAGGGVKACEATAAGGTLPAGNYWRVCLATTTQKGLVTPNTNAWGQLAGSVMAITRCSINNEGSTTSNINVWSK